MMTATTLEEESKQLFLNLDSMALNIDFFDEQEYTWPEFLLKKSLKNNQLEIIYGAFIKNLDIEEKNTNSNIIIDSSTLLNQRDAVNEKVNLECLINEIITEYLELKQINLADQHKNSLKNNIKKILNSVPEETLNSLPQRELRNRIIKMIGFELLSSILSDLSDEEKLKFQEDIKRNPFFNE